jgi:hypothetical protein
VQHVALRFGAYDMWRYGIARNVVPMRRGMNGVARDVALGVAYGV